MAETETELCSLFTRHAAESKDSGCLTEANSNLTKEEKLKETKKITSLNGKLKLFCCTWKKTTQLDDVDISKEIKVVTSLNLTFVIQTLQKKITLRKQKR